MAVPSRCNQRLGNEGPLPQQPASQKNFRKTGSPSPEQRLGPEFAIKQEQEETRVAAEAASDPQNTQTSPAESPRSKKQKAQPRQERSAAPALLGARPLFPARQSLPVGVGRAKAVAEDANGPARAEKAPASKARAKAAGRQRTASPRPAKSQKARAEVFGSLLDTIEEGVAHISTDGVILYANARFAELFGATPDQMGEDSRAHLRDFLAPRCQNDLEAGLRYAAQNPTEGVLKIEDDAHNLVRSVRLFLCPVHWKKATTIKITAAETTALLEKNRALQDQEASLHALSALILQLQDEERRRIARDLHDITGQELAVVIMALSQLANHCDGPGADVQEKITDAAGLVRKIEDEIRTLSYVLHPPLLDEFGLGSALNWYAEGFTKRSGIEVDVEVPQDLPRLPPEKEMALFRVVQEGMTNVLRHSGSKKARIQVSFDAEFVTLSVLDEGRGIQRERLPRLGGRASDGGVGIAGMRERLQQLGGSLEVCRREKGTEVMAVIPIGKAAPIEEPPSDADILRMAEALGYKGAVGEPGAAPATARKRILIVDDHEVTRQGIRALLKDEPDIEICGEAKDGLEAIVKAVELDPDLVIMDLTMPHASGYSAANRIRRSGCRARILFFTTHATPELESAARTGRFEGYVQKSDGARDLVRGIRAVLAGQKFFTADARKKPDASSSEAEAGNRKAKTARQSDGGRS
jgi:signal transduction histidine kinase/DNA-binding NarL/FixJ family response regulator